MARASSAASRRSPIGGGEAQSSPSEEVGESPLDPVAGHSLEVRRLIPAPRERVFDAWTRADIIPRWFKPGAVPLRDVTAELRVGGAWHMRMGFPGEREMIGTGVFLEVDRPRLVVYSWNWEPDPVGRESVVSVHFIDRAGSTEVVLRHSGFPTPAACEAHRHGWAACLTALEATFPATAPAEGAG